MSKEEKKQKKNNRIWELDAFRGILIIGVIVSHIYFDLEYLTDFDVKTPAFLSYIFKYGGSLFIVLSGLCAMIGYRSFRRGLIVLGGGIIVTAASLILGDPAYYIFFGILHLLGICMILFHIFKKLPAPILLILGLAAVICGFYVNKTYVPAEYKFLFVIGFKYKGFQAGDWWPLLPNIGFFWIGNFLGKTLYKNKKTLMPKVKSSVFPLNFLCYCGRKSLWIYLIHQPIVFVVIVLLDKIIN